LAFIPNPCFIRVQSVAKKSNQKIYVGIEIGGTKLQVVLGNEGAKIVERHRLAVNRSRGAAGIRSQLREVLESILSARIPVAVGVGFGGPVDWRTGRIYRSHQIAGWSNFDLGGWLSKLTGAPVFVDNDANVAALGEAFRGAGRGANPVFYVTLGSGVGGGLVVDGKIYHGATPGEAEIGHLRLDRKGTIIESRCSGWAVDAKIRALKRSDPASLLCRLMTGKAGGEARHLAAALRGNDSAARRILQETAADLAFGLSHVVHLFHPAVIVIGGGLAGVGEPLRAAVARELGPMVMRAFAPGPKVRLAELGADTVPIGALELAQAASIATTAKP
jgi:glucokinase